MFQSTVHSCTPILYTLFNLLSQFLVYRQRCTHAHTRTHKQKPDDGFLLLQQLLLPPPTAHPATYYGAKTPVSKPPKTTSCMHGPTPATPFPGGIGAPPSQTAKYVIVQFRALGAGTVNTLLPGAFGSCVPTSSAKLPETRGPVHTPSGPAALSPP